MSDKNVKPDNKKQAENAKPKKIDGQIIAIIALICGALVLFGAAIAIALSDSKDNNNKPSKAPTNSSSIIEDEWTNNY